MILISARFFFLIINAGVNQKRKRNENRTWNHENEKRVDLGKRWRGRGGRGGGLELPVRDYWKVGANPFKCSVRYLYKAACGFYICIV